MTNRDRAERSLDQLHACITRLEAGTMLTAREDALAALRAAAQTCRDVLTVAAEAMDRTEGGAV